MNGAVATKVSDGGPVGGAPASRVATKSLAACLGLGLSCVLAVMVEVAAAYMLRKSGRESFPLVLIGEAASRQYAEHLYGVSIPCPLLDPHLGYARRHCESDGDVPGFRRYETSCTSPAGLSLRIVTLGGSTTDAHISEYNWPRQLGEILARNGVGSIIWNGGTMGFSSNQELIKLIRDVLPLKPDVVISFNGINDLAFTHCVPKHPMVHPYQRKVLSTIVGEGDPHRFMPNLRRLVALRARKLEGIHYGPAVDTIPAEQWARNVRIMDAVAREFEVPYLCFLQPVLGQGSYDPTEEEKEMIAGREAYVSKVLEFYESVRPLARELDFCVDLTEVFAGAQGVYVDHRHPNRQGYGIVAQEMFRELVRRKLVRPDQAGAKDSAGNADE